MRIGTAIVAIAISRIVASTSGVPWIVTNFPAPMPGRSVVRSAGGARRTERRRLTLRDPGARRTARGIAVAHEYRPCATSPRICKVSYGQLTEVLLPLVTVTHLGLLAAAFISSSTCLRISSP